jgi:hypothetical protein
MRFSTLYLHGMSTAAIVAIKRRRIIQKFKDANAFDEATAINAEEHNIRRSFIFKRLTSDGVILPAGKNRYYLDVVRDREVTANRRRKILFIISIVVTAALVWLFFASR